MAFPGTYNFNYYKGDTFEFSIYPKNTDGTAFDLTDFESQFVVSTQRSGGTKVSSTALKESDHIKCTIQPSDSNVWEPASQYVYDVEIYNADYSVVYTLLTGTITVTEQIADEDTKPEEAP